MTQRVVIVDDDRLNLRLMKAKTTEIDGLVVDTFPSSTEALAWLRGKEIDCFIFDYNMPHPNGLEMTRLVRAMDEFAHVPIMIVTGEHERELRYRALDAGANDFVQKPVDYRELVSRLSTLLALQAARKKLAMNVGSLEISLRESEERSRGQAERLEALWRVANNRAVRGEELMLAMLRQGAAAIRSSQRFRGVLGRIEPPDVVVVAVGVDPNDDDPRGKVLRVGLRAPLDQTIVSHVKRSQGWDDLATMPHMPEAARVHLGWRAVISTQFRTGGVRYSLTFASLEPTTIPFDAGDFAYLEVLASSFARQIEVNQLEASLRDAEERSRQHAERLEVLWKIVNNPNLRDEELLLAMLSQAAATIRPGQPYRGMLWQVRGTELIVEAIADSPGQPLVEFQTPVGYAIPLDVTIVGKLIENGVSTRLWDDIQAGDDASTLARESDMRSFMVTTFKAGGATWALSFASDEATSMAFGPQDHAYIEVLASFFANHVQQRWQFDRIQYQQSYDALTGVLNRAQFRSQARLAARTSSHFAIIKVDVHAFRKINDAHGQMIGDAMLVEVASALRKLAATDEIVGRVGGDVFGIFIANANSRDAVRNRAIAFSHVFAQGFSTGDGLGKDFIELSACLGLAIAPEDGAELETIMVHADAALHRAKEVGPDTIVCYEPGLEDYAPQPAAS